MKLCHLVFFAFTILCTSCNQFQTPNLPAPVMPIPTTQQLEWQQMEFYAFVHFNMNTFTNQEWGFGDENPALFNPTQLDCRQWAKVAKDAGMTGIIITAKHHDGFCLWPSAYTEHSIKNSPWKNGEGDVIKELAEACQEYGLKMGIYYSPWDRNHADYGKPEYLTYMRNQLKELLTNYGEIYEVWFDGANGGTGYYGGANEERRVDKKTYYDMQNTYPIIRALQPNAVIFSDAGPDVRWVGNEEGYAFRTMWSNLLRDSVYAGMPEYSKLYAAGQENGTHWVPGETNVSIRPGWYYHEYEDHKVRSLPELIDMYYNSIGRNTTFLLNFPVDKRGLIHENDVAQLEKLTAKIQEDFKDNLINGAIINATQVRSELFVPANAIDGIMDTYWATSDSVTQASLTIEFPEEIAFNRFLIQEHIALGQRVKSFTVEIKWADKWEEIANETTIGYKRILRLPDYTTTAIRFTIQDAKASPCISNIAVYNAPKLVIPPTITRNKNGIVTMTIPEKGVDIYYTTDGTTPTTDAQKYNEPFILTDTAIVNAIAIHDQKQSDIRTVIFDIAPLKWTIINKDTTAIFAIDGNEQTWWESDKNELVIDLGETLEIKGFTYLPMQNRWISGFIKAYEFYVSDDNKNWTLAAKGEFGNILNSPVLQTVRFDKQKAQYIKLTATSTINDTKAGFAEVGVLTTD